MQHLPKQQQTHETHLGTSHYYLSILGKQTIKNKTLYGKNVKCMDGWPYYQLSSTRSIIISGTFQTNVNTKHK